MKITLPLPPNLANSRMHWSKKHRKRKDYLTRCDMVAITEGTGEPWENKARIRATLYVWSLMDIDNLMARLKWPVDWLVRQGYLVDDSPEHLEWTLPKQVVDRKRRRVEIELEPVERWQGS